ncbi:hypothetical protein COV53_03195 [Candidatus Gottesmanbacteria bacterium CG11_big_fil_rev_8_21_14_0_20_37_11]|uniref:Uncharacterized protein n=3 Tax=Candidatus Gottesmaniibacteriota TaxID=1752720 RepID=A0A2M7RPK2_9BACT|nr:MAG: hypothetical protein AUJ73_04900 [Candidatus Gottesmanbacteria bacterium CG1_02_37_22]PIP33057.1 MAG: hypothetical protein COX23_01400 [Candidatus Gottesmanbacteria bacterium CG23_combo_of_CG06-09_8_20_14_all_37_19]PIR08405.1 MAG: hypothetical protein COV53_03195 [Candidatus Gottesmanbacteria bacterium CG11_big_fil_rev_8_21_14_0_20_37_11]PIZ02257.1 MAG: hypothetical protein COY59_05750 [Candidatus Gottesmanbacteria bacterium CG_4_10_14_0_8_um_filter_37_24]
MKINKNWYVKIQQAEVEQFTLGEHIERLIYEAIKSYCGNGKLNVGLSIRDIAKRATLSYSTVFRHLPNLLNKNIIKIVGQNKRLGGTVNVYQVLLTETLSVADNQESVAGSKESVADSGTKLPQLNNLIKKENIFNDITYEEIFPSEEKMSNEVSQKIFAALGGSL